MAEITKIEKLRKTLQSALWTKDDGFKVLSEIASIITSESSEVDGRELVIRALEHREELPNDLQNILRALVIRVGLYPYLENLENLSIKDLIAYEFHRPINMPNNIIFHRAQASAYRKLIAGQNVILSAPTSFGKSIIIDALIASGIYKNIVIVVPTIALIDETRRRLSKHLNYKLITHIQQEPSDNNIFVMTQERVLSYQNFDRIDLFIIDEFYKLKLEADPDRATLLNLALYKLAKTEAQFYLLGPNILGIPENLESKLKQDFIFILENFITVVSEVHYQDISTDKDEEVFKLCESLPDQTLIFCKSPASANKLANSLIAYEIRNEPSEMEGAINWFSREFHGDWTFIRALKSGIGIHHGKLPRSFSQFIVRAFNEKRIKYLICTSTLIEGVNTTAKNIIIYDNKIARKRLDYFTFNNIVGRGGRMFKHFIGNVYIFDDPPQEDLPFVDFPVFTLPEDVSSELLVQLDRQDLSEKAKIRMDNLIENQDLLSIDDLKENIGVSIKGQLKLAQELYTYTELEANEIIWNGYPSKYKQLEKICVLIWSHLVGSQNSRIGSIFSGKQLCFKINQLQHSSDIRSFIHDNIRNDSSGNPDSAIEETLAFLRQWAAFLSPKYLRTFHNIQLNVFQKLGFSTGNYLAYADRTENLFMEYEVSLLEEFGIPIQLSSKFIREFEIGKGIDRVLTRIKEIDLRELDIDPFEFELLSDFQGSMNQNND